MRQALFRLITKLTQRQQQEKELFTFYHQQQLHPEGGKACFQPLTLRLMQELLQLFDGLDLTLKLHAKTNNWTIE